MLVDQRFEQFKALGSLLDEKGAALWCSYLDAEWKGIRKQALRLLNSLITHLKRMDEQRLDRWIAAYCDVILNTGLTESRSLQEWSPIRFNLLYEVVLPRLINGYHQGDHIAVSHLVILSDHFYGKFGTALQTLCQQHQFPENELVFLEEALRVNPADKLALDKLIRGMYRTLDYTIHEVPYGVLMGALQLELDWIARFEALVQQAGREGEFSDFINRVRTYVTSWDDYRSSQGRYSSFESYLRHHGVPVNRHHS